MSVVYAPLLAVTLLALPATSAHAHSAFSSGGTRVIELPAEPSGTEPEVVISPRLSTTFTFDAELLRHQSGEDTVALDRKEAFTLLDAGQTTLRLVPSNKLVPGERLRLVVRFKDGAAPVNAAFVLVVHPAQAERLVEVYREPRAVEFYQREAREARAAAGQCRQELEKERAECAGPGGLASLILTRKLDRQGIKTRDLSRTVTRATGNALVTAEVYSYRAAGMVAVEVRLEQTAGAQPWKNAGAALVDRKGIELKVLPLRPAVPLEPDAGPLRIVVEAEARTNEARGTYALTLWDEGTRRTVTLSGVTFP